MSSGHQQWGLRDTEMETHRVARWRVVAGAGPGSGGGLLAERLSLVFCEGVIKRTGVLERKLALPPKVVESGTLDSRRASLELQTRSEVLNTVLVT